MAQERTFRGYGPEQGYHFLREIIAEEDFQSRGADISPDEIFISDGAKCDSGNIQEIFAVDINMAIPDPVYPVYLDTNVMAGRTGGYQNGRYEGIVLSGKHPGERIRSGASLGTGGSNLSLFPQQSDRCHHPKRSNSRPGWIMRGKTKRLLLYDAAYEIFIRDAALPHSIYEIDGAQEVAIELRSFSKTAGFTGTRCAYTVIPKACAAYDSKGNKHALHPLWNRRHSTKFNGVSYPVQRAAEAAYSEKGKAEVRERIDYYSKTPL